MNVQKVRKTLAFLSFVFFPVTIAYVAPKIAIDGAAKGVFTVSLLTAIIILVVTFVFGRIYCSFACPIGAVQELTFRSNDKHAKRGKLRFLKYFSAFFWLSTIVFLAYKAQGFSSFDPLFATEKGLSTTNYQTYLIYYSGVLFMVAFGIFLGRRAFCQYLCPFAPFWMLSKKVRKILKIPAFGISADKEKCKSCKNCISVCPMSLNVTKNVSEEITDNPDCISCQECISKCSNNVLKYKINKK